MLEFIKNIEFLNKEFLFLLLLLPALVWFYVVQHKKRYALFRFSSLSEIPGLQSIRGRMRAILPILRCLAIAALIIALARPRKTLVEENIHAEGIDIVMVMDLSSSMLAQDFQPDRLEVSKKVASEFIDKRPYDRIGLVVFAGEAFTQCPLTTDHKVLKEFLANLKCGLLEDGTAIGMGLATAVNRLKESPVESKVVILLTDGVNNSGYIKPITAAEIALQFEVTVYTIGVGTTGDALTPVQKRSDGRYIFGLSKVEIDEDLMQRIAQMSGGKYFRATSAEGLQQIYNEIDALEKTEIEITTIKTYKEYFVAFARFAIILLILEFVLRYTLLRTIP